MRSVNAVVAALALGAGSSFSAGGRTGGSYDITTHRAPTGTAVGASYGCVYAPSEGELRHLAMEVETAGGGLGKATLAIRQEGKTLCSLDVDCTATGDVLAKCSGTVAEGVVAEVEWTSSDCTALPQGALSATWRWR